MGMLKGSGSGAESDDDDEGTQVNTPEAHTHHDQIHVYYIA